MVGVGVHGSTYRCRNRSLVGGIFSDSTHEVYVPPPPPPPPPQIPAAYGLLRKCSSGSTVPLLHAVIQELKACTVILVDNTTFISSCKYPHGTFHLLQEPK